MPGHRTRPGRVLAGACLAALLLAPAPRPAAAQEGIVVVSRERILREAVAARRLRDAEAELTERLQAQIDETKAAFAAEEEQLARLRAELPEAEFEARVTSFDQRLRQARRNAQERAAALQKGLQDARAAILAALPPLMERLRVEAGAGLLLNADQVLALDPSLDLTERAIALMDAEGPSPPLPEIDMGPPVAPERAGAASGSAAAGESRAAPVAGPSAAQSDPPVDSTTSSAADAAALPGVLPAPETAPDAARGGAAGAATGGAAPAGAGSAGGAAEGAGR